MIIFIIIYLFIGGIAIKLCRQLNIRDSVDIVLISIFWPISLLAFLGYSFASLIFKKKK